MLTDLRLALRGFARSPGFALLALLLLGLGLGANTAIFGILDAAVLRPLPFPNPEGLVTVHVLGREDRTGAPTPFPWSYPKFDRFRREVTGFEAIAGYGGPTSLNLIGPEGPERLAAEEVSGSYFDVLGLTPAAGRLFQVSFDATPGQPMVLVLSHHLWRQRFGGDPKVVGTELRLNGQPLTVIGVAPAGFRGLTGGADLFVPLTLAPIFEYKDILEEAGNHWFLAVARLKPGVTAEAAGADAARVGALVDRAFPFLEQVAPWSAGIQPLAASRVDPGFRKSVWLLAGAVALVLLIVCVNLTGLLVARSASRRHEMAVRLALGASRGRLIRLVLTETLLLSLGGCLLGLLAGTATSGVLARLLGAQHDRNGGAFFFDTGMVRIDGRVMLFGLALAIVAALAAAVLPAIQASRPALNDSLKSGLAGAMGRFGWRRAGLQQALVVGEIALALVLLAGAGLLTRSFSRLTGLSPGFEPEGVLTFRFAAADGDFAVRDPVEFRREVVERLQALPGVLSASIGLCPPLGPRCSGSVVTKLDGQKLQIGGSAIPIGLHPVTTEHFRTLGIPILRGQSFEGFDRPGAPRAILINETAAKRLFPGQDPIGHRLSAASFYFGGGDSLAQVIGVVKDVRYGEYDAGPEPDLYFPLGAIRTFGRSGTIFVHNRGDPLRIADLARAELKLLDPNLPVFRVMTMRELAGAALARPRFAATLLGGFAGVALLLAALGLYALLAFGVAQQTRELGLRMALGASELRVLRGVVRRGLLLAGAGIVIGMGAALALQRVMTGLLYQTSPSDPATLIGVAVLMALAALIAALIPARRATRVDPLVALRSD